MKIYFLLLFVLLKGVSYSQDAKKFYEEGLQLKKNKKSALALESFKKAVALKNDYIEARYEMGWCYNDLKNYKEAIIILKEVRKSWTDYAKVFFELGYAFSNDRQFDSAKTAFIKCLQIKSDYSGINKQLAYLEYERKRNEDALVYFNRQVEYTPDGGKDYLFWYRKGFSENALKQYANAILSLQNSLLYKKDYLNTYLELGFAKTKLKNDNYGAMGHFKQAMNLDPKSHIAFNGIGEIYRDNIKNCDSAIYWYNKSLEVKPKERKACYGIGYCLNSNKQYANAIPYLQTAIEQETNYTAAYIDLGYSYYKLKRYSEAETNLKKAVQITPDSQNAHYYLCTMYIEQKRKADAMKEAEELKRLNSKYALELKTKVLNL